MKKIKIDRQTYSIERDGALNFQSKIYNLDGTEFRSLRGYTTEASAQAAVLRHLQRMLAPESFHHAKAGA
jgi:hypothetical protein